MDDTATTAVWRMTAAGMALVAVCYGLARFAYDLFVPAFRAEFGLTDTLLGGSLRAATWATAALCSQPRSPCRAMALARPPRQPGRATPP